LHPRRKQKTGSRSFRKITGERRNSGYLPEWQRKCRKNRIKYSHKAYLWVTGEKCTLVIRRYFFYNGRKGEDDDKIYKLGESQIAEEGKET